ncbi:hypothetical protein EG348_01405 [Chryseobacterium sp. G0201]|nr:hypothetical protein EG348_01405 [Chryseobacterium sp. G0201]
MPLRKLIIEAENIVYAEVVDIKKNKAAISNDNWFKDHVAVLKANEVLKGKITNTQIIEVYFSPDMSCPAPAYYEKGTFTLAFLDKKDTDNTYSTYALSYGSKTLDKKDYSIYRSRILEMKNILTINSEEEKQSKTVDWLVECALEKVTKWEGTYELSPESDFMSFYDQNQDTFVKKFQLNDIQKEKLRANFFTEKTLEYDDLGLIDLIVKPNDKELLDLLIIRFKENYKQMYFGNSFFMSKIVELSKREDLKQILKRNEDLDMFAKDYDKKSTKITHEFIEKLE